MRRVVTLALALAWLPACASKPASADPMTAEQPSPQCADERNRRFDFWLGRWVVKTADGTVAGHNHIAKEHGGCAVIERWRSAKHGGGTSINYFDPVKQKWVQNWIDASGSVIQLEGDLVDGSMILEGRYAQADGTEQRMRGTWTPLDDGRVRQFFETSTDGVTWTPWFEGFYSRE